jgi:SPX domain protein involved in polyphosphate accumulation
MACVHLSHAQELLDSGYLVEVHKFSKFIHGTATLFPDMVRLDGE